MWNFRLRTKALLLLLSTGALAPAGLAFGGDKPGETVESGLKDIWAPPPRGDGFSSTEFRPRGPSLLTAVGAPEYAGDDPSRAMSNATAWQQWRDYRTRDRVRLVTLWESSASSFSLQASKKGDPSLQWTSRVFNHEGATRGVLDRLLSVAIGGAGERLKAAAKQKTLNEPPRPAAANP
jgi:hypothetical protein